MIDPKVNKWMAPLIQVEDALAACESAIELAPESERVQQLRKCLPFHTQNAGRASVRSFTFVSSCPKCGAIRHRRDVYW